MMTSAATELRKTFNAFSFDEQWAEVVGAAALQSKCP